MPDLDESISLNDSGHIDAHEEIARQLNNRAGLLDYAEGLVAFDAPAGTITDVTGLSINFTAGDRPYVVRFHCILQSISGAPAGFLSYITDAADTILMEGAENISSNAFFRTHTIERFFTASSGVKSYKVRAQSLTGDSVRIDPLIVGSDVRSPYFVLAYEL
jgi:hypothetical protein